MKELNRFFLLALIGLSCACHSSKLQRAPLSADAFELAAANQHPLELSIQAPQGDLKVGHQYLLLFIPFGRVSIDSPHDLLFRESYLQLAMLGYRPLSLQAQSSHNRVHLNLKYVQASAYDLLFLRRIKSKVIIEAQLLQSPGKLLRSVTNSATCAHSARKGFRPQLEACLNEAMHEALAKSLQDLGLFQVQ